MGCYRRTSYEEEREKREDERAYMAQTEDTNWSSNVSSLTPANQKSRAGQKDSWFSQSESRLDLLKKTHNWQPGRPITKRRSSSSRGTSWSLPLCLQPPLNCERQSDSETQRTDRQSHGGTAAVTWQTRSRRHTHASYDTIPVWERFMLSRPPRITKSCLKTHSITAAAQSLHVSYLSNTNEKQLKDDRNKPEENYSIILMETPQTQLRPQSASYPGQYVEAAV